MKRLQWLCLLFLMGVAVVSFAGDIQVTCPPDLRIFLDGQLKGTSNAMEDGLFLASVPAGAHTIRVEKDGFLPKEIRIEVADRPIEVRVGKLTPQPFAQYQKTAEPEEVKQLFGELVITSAPQNCEIEIDGKAESKEIPILSIGRVISGKHTISFSKPGYETISKEIFIHPGAQITVRGDLFAGKIETIYEGTGSLKISSKPKRCTIHFRGEREDKIHMYHNITKIPAGEYPMIVEIKGRELKSTVLIRDEMKTVLEVSFIKGDKPFTVSYVPH